MNFFDLLSLQFLSGPIFLMVYAAAILLAGLYGRSLCRGLNQTGVKEIPRQPLTAYELAYVKGGESRVVETAVVKLQAAKRLCLDSTVTPATLEAAGSGTPECGLEAAVLQAAQSATGLHSIKRSGPVIRQLSEIGQSLIDRGWLLSGRRIRSVQSKGTLVFLGLMAIGLTRTMIGVMHNRPVMFLVAEGILLLVTANSFLNSIPGRPRETDAYVKQQEISAAALASTASRRYSSLDLADQIMATALFGSAPLLALLTPPIEYSSSSYSDSSSTSSCSTSTSSCSSSSSSCSSSSSNCSSSSSSCGSSCSSSCSSSTSGCGG